MIDDGPKHSPTLRDSAEKRIQSRIEQVRDSLSKSTTELTECINCSLDHLDEVQISQMDEITDAFNQHASRLVLMSMVVKIMVNKQDKEPSHAS